MGGDLNGRGGMGIGWPKSRASRFTVGVGVDVPDAEGDGWAIVVMLKEMGEQSGFM